MRYLLILNYVYLAVALYGCSVDNSHLVQHSYTTEQYDASTGLTLEPSENMWVSFEEMNDIYVNTEACMGMTAPGPTVLYRDFYDYGWGLGGFALYHPGGHIFMNTYATKIPVGIERDKRTDIEALEHEFVHHILNMNGLDWHHGNPMFALCGVGVNTYN